MKYFLEVGSHQIMKNKYDVCGDVILTKKVEGENRKISILADGLGSGVKANVLATLTATMAINYIKNEINITKAAQIILETLPICKVRKIGYSTFTIIDTDIYGKVKIIEYDNPDYILMNGTKIRTPERKEVILKTISGGPDKLYYSEFQARPGDRIIVFSDGVSQSGLGKINTPLGWQMDSIKEFLKNTIQKNRFISAQDLAVKLASKALFMDSNKAADDISCSSIYFRKPRRTLVVSGPPFHKEKDNYFAHLAAKFDGTKVICGGTTANIISRELNRRMDVDLEDFKTNPNIPPTAKMKGFELITEGTLTLTKALTILRKGDSSSEQHSSAIRKLVNILLRSDVIHFLIGTTINEAHQDPTLPHELEIRRNLIKRFSKLLSTKYLKETDITFM